MFQSATVATSAQRAMLLGTLGTFTPLLSQEKRWRLLLRMSSVDLCHAFPHMAVHVGQRRHHEPGNTGPPNGDCGAWDFGWAQKGLDFFPMGNVQTSSPEPFDMGKASYLLCVGLDVCVRVGFPGFVSVRKIEALCSAGSSHIDHNVMGEEP